MSKDYEVRDLAGLRRLAGDGERLKYVFFWGHQPPRAGAITASCFSQWYASPFEVDAIVYPTAEHFMMAEKARLFEDDSALARILSAPTPGAAKRRGREVAGFSEELWTEVRMAVAIAGNLAKFRQNPPLGDYLVGTQRRILAEASPVDRIWGIGLEASDPKASDPEQWLGLNLLGFALMDVRARLSAAPS